MALVKDTRIDFLVNNAAIFGGMRKDSLLNVEWSYYEHFMSVNMNGVLRCTRLCAQHIAARGGGAIVNQSSTAAYLCGGYYGLAKAAVNYLTANLAVELGPRTSVSTALPRPHRYRSGTRNYFRRRQRTTSTTDVD